MKRSALIVIVVIVFGIGAILLIGHSSSSDLSSDPTACVNQTFQSENRGHCVSDIQNLLNWSLYGIDSPIYKPVTGSYTQSTASLVLEFQNTNNLPKNAIVQKATWEKLCQISDATGTTLAAAKDAGCKV
jgi:peptidoglycan hydrolase-like protein with peptidoglycan-binding domain